MTSILDNNSLKNLFAVIVGCVIAIMLVSIIDTIFGWYTGVEGSNTKLFPRSTNIYGLGWSIKDKRKKTFNEATGIYSKKKKKEYNGEVLYDVIYNFDTYYRRVTPDQPNEARDNFIIFFGGSQTFGEGLNDWETIPALVQKDAPSYQVYNYAYHGYGPHQMLRKLETDTLKDEVMESRGIAFFQYFTFHIQRVLGTMQYVSWAGGKAPYYRVNDQNQLEYPGSFASGRFAKTFIYWLLNKSAIVQNSKLDLSPKITSKDYDLVCLVMSRSRDLFLDQYPESRFVVILGLTTSKEDPFIEECMRKNNIEHIDLRGLYDDSDEDLSIPYDGHYTFKATQLVAKQLLPIVNQ